MTFTTRGCYWCYNSSSTFYNITFHYYSEASSLTPFLLRYRLRPSYRKEFSSVLFLLDSFLMFCQAGKVLFKKASLPAFSSSFSQLHSLQESEMEPAQLNTFYSLLKLFLAEFSSVFFSRKKNPKSISRVGGIGHNLGIFSLPILPIWKKNKVILTLLIWWKILIFDISFSRSIFRSKTVV